MKKITSYFSLLLMMLFVSMSAKAQDTAWIVDEESPLDLTPDMISSPVTDPQEGSIEALLDDDTSTFWHSTWHAGDGKIGTHYFQVDYPDMPERFGFSFTRRSTDRDHTTKWGIYGAPSDEATKTECTKLGEWECPFQSKTETLISPVFETQGFTKIRFYIEQTTSSTGGDDSSRGYSHLTEFRMYNAYEVDSKDVAIMELQQTLEQVYNVINDMEPGTAPSQYDAALLEALQAALEAALIIDEPEGADLTAEDVQALNAAIKEAYAAVVASRVPYAQDIKPGYYFLRAGLAYYTTGEGSIDPETEEPIPGENTYHEKAMYADGTKAMWGDIEKDNVKYLWKIEAVADTTKCYTLTNMAHKMQPTATIGTLGQEGKPVSFDYAGESEIDQFQEGLVTYYNIRLTTASERSGATYFHQNNHGGGTGKGSNIVGWYHTFDADLSVANASEWVLEPVDDEVAKAIIEGPATQIASMIEDAASVIAKVPAQLEVAEDVHTSLNTEIKLITDASQFHSPWTQSKWGGADGGELEDGVLIDGNGSTYWHSKWASGGTPHGVQYLEISDIDTSIDGVAFEMVRRNTASDHLSKFSVYGVNEEDAYTGDDDFYQSGSSDEFLAEKNSLEKLAELTLGNTSAAATAISAPFETKGYSIIRIYEEETYNCTTSGCWHAAEIQLYPAKMGQYWKDGTSQYAANQAIIETLQKAIEKWEAAEYSVDKVSDPDEAPFATDYKALVDAYNAWAAVYVDPANLRTAVKKAENIAKGIVVGNNPGQWKDEAAAGAAASLIEKAVAYDKSGKYTPEQSEEYIKALSAESILGTANPVKTGKWYTIRFGTEEEYDEAGWDKAPVQEVFNENINKEESHALYGKLIAVAKHANETDSYTDANGNDHNVTIYNAVELEDEDATFNAGVAFIDKDEIVNEDHALWQFIAIGDTAYVLQNKATGLYLRANGAMGATRMSVHPTLYKQSAIGYGKSLIKADALTGENNAYLHAERSTNNLVTWDAYTVDSNSALYIEEKSDVAAAPSNEFTMNVWPGQVQTMCYPAELTAKNGTFYKATIEDTKVTLNPIADNKALAGQPVVYVAEGEYEKLQNNEEAEGYNGDKYEQATFVHGTEFVAQAGEDGSLVGCFVNTTIEKGNVWAANNSAEKAGFNVTKNTSNTVGANSAYIKAAIEDTEAEIELVISDEESAIAAIQTVSKMGGIYTIDGKFVGNGNLNTVKGMAKGIYVVNGVKVIKK